MTNPESITNRSEHNDSKELDAIHDKQHEALRESLEKAERDHKSISKESLEQVQAEALDQAKPAEQLSTVVDRSPAEKRRGLITKRHREQSFDRQLQGIQPHLSKQEQLFSKIIHKKSVETVSDSAATTVARPNAMLAGSISAFLLVTAVYLVAKYYGYQLSGFETIGAFVLGWVLGLIYDYTRLLAKRK